MSITDELRREAQGHLRYLYTSGQAKHLLAIADRIDAAHERLCSRSRSNGYNDGFTDGFNDIESWVVDHEDAMAEHCFVRLPKDGEAPCKQLGEWIEKRGLITGPLDHDGELWHKGDMSASPLGVIENIVFDGQCWQICGHDTSAPWIPADSLLHYHVPTVEDVLTEFAEKITDSQIPGVHPTYKEAIAEYAAKLRLAGSDAE